MRVGTLPSREINFSNLSPPPGPGFALWLTAAVRAGSSETVRAYQDQDIFNMPYTDHDVGVQARRMDHLRRTEKQSVDDISRVVSIKKLFHCHVDSFNHFVNSGLSDIVRGVESQHISVGPGSRQVDIWLEDLKIESLRSKVSAVATSSSQTPRSCREVGETYKTSMSVSYCWRLQGNDAMQRRVVQLGQCPVMVQSNVCSLARLCPAELVAFGEEANEAGGYFIINGIERMIRMIIMQRRHHILGLRRRAFLKRSPLFTEYATVMRCVSNDEHSSTIRLHYMRNGSLKVAFQHRREEFFIPAGLVLRSLVACSDAELHERACMELLGTSSHEETFVKERLAIIQEECQSLYIFTQISALSYLGQHFRTLLEASASESDAAVGERFLRDTIFIHLSRNGDKLSLLLLMMNKLLTLVTGGCGPDDPDSLVNQEVLLPGLLLQKIVREKIQISFQKVLTQIRGLDCRINEDIGRVIDETASLDIGKALEYILATGNLVSPTGLGLSQASGFTIVAEKLNYFRYLSHFRSVHRGAYFMELRTTAVRKLLPESWGFLCPVHTPDGSPCGLLNHLTEMCEVVVPDKDPLVRSERLDLIKSKLAWALVDAEHRSRFHHSVPVIVEGVHMGYISIADVERAVAALREAKTGSQLSLQMTEICHIPVHGEHGLFPGLYIFYGPSRLMRPVQQVHTGKIELVGTLEQSFLSICSLRKEMNDIFTHSELKMTSALSCIASLTPWSDFNQSPRNMYQCQMAKQTMGTPMHSICFRSDTKLYRLHTPQRPVALTYTYDKYALDNYALGTNAVVAVLAYTGYDMEDAMILNKGSLTRGFAHATLYKTIVETASKHELIGMNASQSRTNEHIDSFGTVDVGSVASPGSTVLRVNNGEGLTKSRQIRIKGTDPAVVDRVVLTSTTQKGNQNVKRAAITFRYDRNPVIGDKFSSRHGQKGVLSFLWPEEDMPFCERTGVRPDVIINPHAFPSRMTIGMLVESLASKAGAMAAVFADATPFKRDKKYSSPAERYGSLLREHGYNFCGNESMINGYTGESFSVDIFIGVVYYQRLRHMVSFDMIFFFRFD